MSKTPRGQTISLPDGHGRKFINASGFNHAALGSDSVPGPTKGAPLVTSKTTDDFDAKRSIYLHGNPYNPHSGNEAGVLGPRVVYQNSGRYEGPIPTEAEMADKNIISKAGEVHANDPSAGVGVRPTGALNR